MSSSTDLASRLGIPALGPAANELAPLTAEEDAALRAAVKAKLDAKKSRDALVTELAADSTLSAFFTEGRALAAWEKAKNEGKIKSGDETAPPDPEETLDKWPAKEKVEAALRKTLFTLSETMTALRLGGTFPIGQSAEFDFRQSLFSLGQAWDKKSPLNILQDKEQSCATTIVLRGVYKSEQGQPVFAVEWMHATTSNRKIVEESAKVIQFLLKKHGAGNNTTASSKEQTEHWLPLLQKNTIPGKKTSHPALKVSFIEAPLAEPYPLKDNTKVTSTGQLIRKGSRTCARCREQGKSSICSGCHGIDYCGPTCQKAHWTFHKAECKKKAEPLAGTVVFSAAAPPGSDARFQTAISHTGGGTISANTEAEPANPHGQRKFLVKIQSTVIPNQPVLMYDETRDLMRHIEPREEAYEGLARACRNEKAFGGIKVYILARREGKYVRAFLEEIPKNQLEIAKVF